MTTRLLLLASAVVPLLAACAHREAPLPAAIPPVSGEPRTAFALRVVDVAPGTGDPVEPRRCIFAHYTGWLRDGTRFDSSRDPAPDGTPRTPIAFPQGARRVIAGWDAGFEGMRVGARRRLFIPYPLAYGEPGRPPVIPPKAELIFDVEVMAVADTLPRLRPTDPAPRCPEWAEVAPGAQTSARSAPTPTAPAARHASGTFEVRMTPRSTDEADGATPLARLSLDKRFHGALDATGRGEMLSAVTPVPGSAGYVAMERVAGTLDGRAGSFVLQHSGTMERGEQRLALSVVPGSGTGELEGIAGTMRIRIEDGQHFYELDYTLPPRD